MRRELALRESPYADEARERKVRTMQRAAHAPRGLAGLVRWYATAWDLEAPDKDWTGGVWSAPQQYDRHGPAKGWATSQGDPLFPSELVGGSLLGAPRMVDAFRRYIENSPHETDRDGYYLRPLHCALARMEHGSGERIPMPMTARELFRFAWGGFDCDAFKASFWASEQALLYLEKAIEVVWTLYHDAPMGRQVA